MKRALVAVTGTLAYVVSLVVLVVWIPLTGLVLLFTWPFDRTRRVAGRFFRYLGVIWSHSFPYWRIHVEGSWPAEKQAFVVVANHQSYLDTFAMCNIHHEMKWVAKKELFRIPIFGWGLHLAGDLELDRGDGASAIALMAKARRYLASGMSVSIFPEGTRSPDAQLLPFKPGAFKLAVQSGAPLLPVVVSGTARGLPKGGPWIHPASVTVRILCPVQTAGLHAGDVRGLREDVRGRMQRALDEIHALERAQGTACG